MYKLRDELIKSIVKSLKIDDNPFNFVTIQDMIKNVDDNNLQEFYQGLFGSEHSYLNGLDRVAKVSQRFCINDDSDSLATLKAKELITLCETLNTQIGEDAKRMGTDFVKLVDSVKLPTISSEDISILDKVKPYTSHKQLICNIRLYQTSFEALTAFKNAIKNNEEIGAIENSQVRKMIKDMR